MNNVNILKPNKENLNLFLLLGSLFFALGIFDFILNNFYEKNVTSFLPSYIVFLHL
jgi:general L-amino acid transport system permease protein